jgi:hypothetical protein
VSSKYIIRSGIYSEVGAGQDLPQLQFANLVREGGGTTTVMTLQQRNVGIGTTNPRTLLDVTSSSGDAAATIQTSSESQDSILYLGTPVNSTGAVKTALIAEGIGSWSRANLHFCLNNNSASNDYPATNATLSDSRMIIQPSGNVGIGTTVPNNILDVAGTISNRGGTSNTTTGFINVSQGDTTSAGTVMFMNPGGTGSRGYIGNVDASRLLLYGESGIDVAIHAGTTERLRLTSSGSVGIGTNQGTVRNGVDIYHPVYTRLPVSVTSGTSLSLNITQGSRNDGTYYFITSPGFNSVTTVGFTASVNGGSFWTLYNSTGSYLSITVTGGHILIPNLNPFPIPPYSSATITAHPTVGNSYLIM